MRPAGVISVYKVKIGLGLAKEGDVVEGWMADSKDFLVTAEDESEAMVEAMISKRFKTWFNRKLSELSKQPLRLVTGPVDRVGPLDAPPDDPED